MKKEVNKDRNSTSFLSDGVSHREEIVCEAKKRTYIDTRNPAEAKAIFDKFFNEDLYGKYSSDENIILSTGALNQNEFSLPHSLKFGIDFALRNNWYGYSCSLGRESARIALADLENYRVGSQIYKKDNIVLIQGVTAGLFHLISFLKEINKDDGFSILTHYPTYVPFVAACNKIAPTKVVNFFGSNEFDVDSIVNGVDDTTKVILLLGDFNPLGKIIKTSFVNKLIEFCEEKGIYIIVDEAGAKYPENDWKGLRQSKFVIRMDSLSKKVSVPGMKLGHFVADDELVAKYYERASTTYGGPASFFYFLQEIEARFDLFYRKGLSKIGYEELALFGESYNFGIFFINLLYWQYKKNKEVFELKIRRHRNLIVRKLSDIHPRLVKKIIIPETGINVFAQLNVNCGSYELFEKMITEKKTSVFPGVCSAVDDGCWIRITSGVDWETLSLGLDNLIDFLKAEWVKDRINNDKLLSVLLLELGKYGTYRELSFFEHLYDVLEKAEKINEGFKKKFQLKLDSNLLRDLVLCHDAGKVISVIVFRIMRIFYLQERYDRVPKTALLRLRDEDLLGLKREIEKGVRFSKSDFFKMFSFLDIYDELIDWDSNVSPRDMVFTKKMLNQLLSRKSNQHKRIKRIESIIMSNHADIDDLRIGDNPYVFILDLADKLADYDVSGCVTMKKISKSLRKKRMYVIKRYCNNDKTLKADVCREFNNIYKLVKKSGIFD